MIFQENFRIMGRKEVTYLFIVQLVYMKILHSIQVPFLSVRGRNHLFLFFFVKQNKKQTNTHTCTPHDNSNFICHTLQKKVALVLTTLYLFNRAVVLKSYKFSYLYSPLISFS